jgi:hypothetical protein
MDLLAQSPDFRDGPESLKPNHSRCTCAQSHCALFSATVKVVGHIGTESGCGNSKPALLLPGLGVERQGVFPGLCPWTGGSSHQLDAVGSVASNSRPESRNINRLRKSAVYLALNVSATKCFAH